ncbi:MAG TPA: TM2 domain-containing protein [Euryarchaeota archaeon]|nr:TM2 domain-containing protein [Euryarchaeota archaeon]
MTDNLTTKNVIRGEKSPIVALLLNFFCGLFGVGYFYIGQWQKALALIGFWFVGSILLSLISMITFGLGSFLFVLYPVVSVAVIIDAYMQADIMNKGGMVGHWTFFNKGI